MQATQSRIGLLRNRNPPKDETSEKSGVVTPFFGQIVLRFRTNRFADYTYSTNTEGINGGGETEEEARREALQCIELQKELGNLPRHDTYEPIFHYAPAEVCSY